MKPLLTIEQLHSLLRYDPDTGLLWWRRCPNSNLYHTWQTTPAGSLHHEGYIQIRVMRRPLLAHRVAWALYYGEWPHLTVDHRNTIRTDNRIENLRLATFNQQAHNSVIPRNNTSGTKGVSFNVREKKWRASILANGQYHGRDFVKKEDAVTYITSVREQFHGEFTRHE